MLEDFHHLDTVMSRIDRHEREKGERPVALEYEDLDGLLHELREATESGVAFGARDEGLELGPPARILGVKIVPPFRRA